MTADGKIYASPFGTQRITVREQDLRGRWFRVKFDASSRKPAPKRIGPPFPSIEVPNALQLHSNHPVRRYPAVGRCIYCGALEFEPGTGRKLSEEHIIAEGLGSLLILPEASCRECACKTAKIEGNVLGTILLTPRRHLGIRGKKRKRNETSYPHTVVVDGKDVKVHLPLEHAPSFIFMPQFVTPGILTTERSGIGGFWVQELGADSFSRMADRGMPVFASAALDTVKFCQMLAKIAHGFAVAELGIDGFTHLLPSLILRELGPKENWLGGYHLVGGISGNHAASEAQHVLGWTISDPRPRSYLVVVIRLFANFESPIFEVVAGKLSEVQLGQAFALAAALECRPDKTHGQPR